MPQNATPLRTEVVIHFPSEFDSLFPTWPFSTSSGCAVGYLNFPERPRDGDIVILPTRKKAGGTIALRVSSSCFIADSLVGETPMVLQVSLQVRLAANYHSQSEHERTQVRSLIEALTDAGWN
ncbi:MAG: hypothetical protein KBE09_02460 [Candidatus Pacebacteria bacterium]|nr:hypothetical protein [Candidatus Paceibacterota bacterium]